MRANQIFPLRGTQCSSKCLSRGGGLVFVIYSSRARSPHTLRAVTLKTDWWLFWLKTSSIRLKCKWGICHMHVTGSWSRSHWCIQCKYLFHQGDLEDATNLWMVRRIYRRTCVLHKRSFKPCEWWCEEATTWFMSGFAKHGRSVFNSHLFIWQVILNVYEHFIILLFFFLFFLP